jgi:hypothetical protein
VAEQVKSSVGMDIREPSQMLNMMGMAEEQRQQIIIKATDEVFNMMMDEKKTKDLPDWITKMRDVQINKSQRKPQEMGFENVMN